MPTSGARLKVPFCSQQSGWFSHVARTAAASLAAINGPQDWPTLLTYRIFSNLICTLFSFRGLKKSDADYYSSDSPSSHITESVCLVGLGRLKESAD